MAFPGERHVWIAAESIMYALPAAALDIWGASQLEALGNRAQSAAAAVGAVCLGVVGVKVVDSIDDWRRRTFRQDDSA